MNTKEICLLTGALLGAAAVTVTVLIKTKKVCLKKNILSRKEQLAILPDKTHKKTQEVKEIIDQAKKTLYELEEAIDKVQAGN
ncbi:MAG: hypothetical protein J5758_07005 [Abditibacteriota bacterium]|nr:hypothetical protein [Abditibacteriota bacterium]